MIYHKGVARGYLYLRTQQRIGCRLASVIMAIGL
jgi:hypothetical protein